MIAPLTLQPPPLRTVVVDGGDIVTQPWAAFFRVLLTPRTWIGSGDHADRPAAADVPLDSLYLETDRGTTMYQVQEIAGVPTWRWIGGEMRGTLSPDQKPASLGTDDAGFRFYATDFRHKYRWSGSAWLYAIEDGDPGSGYIQWAIAAPNDGGLWQRCDGSTVTRSLPAGTTGSITTPNLDGLFIKAGNAYTGSSVAAVGAGLTGDTGNESGHTHGAGTLATGNPSLLTGVTAGGVAVAASTHLHTISGNTGLGSGHTHDAGTLAVDNTAQPAHMVLLAYMRL